MAQATGKSFESPDETRPFEGKGRLDIVEIAGRKVGRAVFEPGWKWSNNVKPIAQTESCQVHHVHYCESGRMTVHMDDGTDIEVEPGSVYEIPPGHDAEVVGDEACVMLHMVEEAGYAKTPE
ncbi:MAG: cupin domain-containing protein [Solirubrobacterales bacterium]